MHVMSSWLCCRSSNLLRLDALVASRALIGGELLAAKVLPSLSASALVVVVATKTVSFKLRMSSLRNIRNSPSLPGRYANILDAVRVLEHLGDLLERLSSCLREHEIDVDRHDCAEDREDDIGL